jgi:hypothetical protein
MNGKAYANRKPVNERPESDNYPTPIPLIIELEKLGILKRRVVYHDPGCGDGQLVNTINSLGYKCTGDDIRMTGNDFLLDTRKREAILTNAPFSIYDDFILHAKEVSPIVISIGKTNFFGSHSRTTNGLWRNLKFVYTFDRQIDYRTPLGSMELNVGNLVTCWYVWDRSWKKDYAIMRTIDVQKYCTLGAVKE